MKSCFKRYCVGCGLCQACAKAELNIDNKGYYYPATGDEKWMEAVCPIGNLPKEEYNSSSIWGRREAVYYGWSDNIQVRTKASSGGVVSEIAAFLLNTKTVDGIIHISADALHQTENVTTISYSVEDVYSKCGSRYSISHPLDILDRLDLGKTYAFIGKPCDIVTLRNYQKVNPDNKRVIPILLSFFCMGLPSVDAQEKLLTALNSDRESCRILVYRGNGWPGFATAVNEDGSSKQIDYSSSWGKILGRDLMPACRFCMDGIGEAADISCGDAWYVGENGEPDFSEHEGRNIVFARTQLGLEILKKMENIGTVTLKVVDNPETYLATVQRSQFFRRASMKSRIAALRIMGKAYPRYPKEMLEAFSQHITVKERLKTFLGTCRRILKGAI